MISIAQIRGARGLLGWSQTKLAFEARVSIATIKRLEAQGTIKVSNDTREAARNALEAAGVDFIDENGGGPGVATEETADWQWAKALKLKRGGTPKGRSHHHQAQTEEEGREFVRKMLDAAVREILAV